MKMCGKSAFLVRRFCAIVIAFASVLSAHGFSGNASPISTPHSRSKVQYQSNAESSKAPSHIFFPFFDSLIRGPAIHTTRSPTLNSNGPSRSPSPHGYTRQRMHDSSSWPMISSHHHNHHQHYDPNREESKILSPSAAPTQQQFPSTHHNGSPSPAVSPSPMVSSAPTPQPSVSPLGPSVKKTTGTLPLPFRYSPPNKDCTMITCSDPFTYTSSVSGHPCGCVLPIQVKLSFDMSLYSFSPLVLELREEIASSLSVNTSQVRIVGANEDHQQLEKTIALINLVPLRDKFKYDIPYSISDKFWRRQIFNSSSPFRSYEVLYVHYPGLPPSPPSATSDFSMAHSHSFPVNGLPKPLGVDIPRLQRKNTNRNVIAIIILSSVTAFITFSGIILIVNLKRRSAKDRPRETTSVSSLTKPSGTAQSVALEGKFSGAPPSLLSSSPGTVTFTGTVKVFSVCEIQQATDGLCSSRILGKGGFGVVYSGILNNGKHVAVKVLKRNDHQGGREFMAEVEMLSRLHHKNLVKLIGICQEDLFRCLVYELVPNGSVDSHLHGVDKDIAPLDWESRMKIALGAAQGLAYLHEDSNPCVIHCDFKSSNILLDHDFTAKVSDFGLARTALDEGTHHISTQVIGTFGYLAPEYAMTGHLLVKSDVYSYGVVLLELLTGRKPVDLSQPPGRENLVAWARSTLKNDKDSVETMIDPSLSFRSTGSMPLDRIYKVAMVASMCVSSEVSRRPSMGEVVQALKLVCSELDDNDDGESYGDGEYLEGSFRSSKWVNLSDDVDLKDGMSSEGLSQFGSQRVPSCRSTSNMIRSESMELKLEQHSFGVKHYFSSGHLGLGKKGKFWERLRGLKRGSSSEHDAGSSRSA